jgi:hypothetical protein
MNPWAQDKVRQLDTDTLTAFGIRLSSRHAKASEMIELISFALEAAHHNVNMFVREAFYDSGSSCCEFTLLESISTSAEQTVLACAQQTISQFLWHGGIHHGQPLLSSGGGEPL